MARIRSIKHGFFTNDILAECDYPARLLFAGLWVLADREGRLEDRPKKIKAELLPYDNCDAETLLSQLAGYGFIERYEANGTRYIQITNFLKHQKPHKMEAKSSIPPSPNYKIPVAAENEPDEADEKPEITRQQESDPSPVPECDKSNEISSRVITGHFEEKPETPGNLADQPPCLWSSGNGLWSSGNGQSGNGQTEISKTPPVDPALETLEQIESLVFKATRQSYRDDRMEKNVKGVTGALNSIGATVDEVASFVNTREKPTPTNYFIERFEHWRTNKSNGNGQRVVKTHNSDGTEKPKHLQKVVF